MGYFKKLRWLVALIPIALFYFGARHFSAKEREMYRQIVDCLKEKSKSVFCIADFLEKKELDFTYLELTQVLSKMEKDGVVKKLGHYPNYYYALNTQVLPHRPRMFLIFKRQPITA